VKEFIYYIYIHTRIVGNTSEDANAGTPDSVRRSLPTPPIPSNSVRAFSSRLRLQHLGGHPKDALTCSWVDQIYPSTESTDRHSMERSR